jgi:predicted acyl esterase
MTADGPASWTDDKPLLSEGDVLSGDAPDESVVLVGEPLAATTRLVGIPYLDATVTTDKESTFLTPVIFKESPTGQRTVLTRSALNSRNRNGERVSEVFEPGTQWLGHARFQPVDTIVPAGYRLGVAVMSMNTNEVLYPDTTQATNQLDLAASGLRLFTAPKVEPPA